MKYSTRPNRKISERHERILSSLGPEANRVQQYTIDQKTLLYPVYLVWKAKIYPRWKIHFNLSILLGEKRKTLEIEMLLQILLHLSIHSFFSCELFCEDVRERWKIQKKTWREDIVLSGLHTWLIKIPNHGLMQF